MAARHLKPEPAEPAHLGWLLIRVLCGLAFGISALMLILTDVGAAGHTAGAVLLTVGLIVQGLLPV